MFDKTTPLSKGITAQPIKLNTNVIIGALKKTYLSANGIYQHLEKELLCSP